MYRFLCFIAMVAAACAAGATTAQIPVANDAHPSGYLTEQYFLVDGIQLSDAEATQLVGGDVHVDMDDMRTSVTVRVYDPQPDPRPWGARPDEVYTLPISAKIQNTIRAPFYPTAASALATRGMTGLTSKPIDFPDGLWKITGVRSDPGEYGPYFINTNAVGIVEVYQNGKYLGKFSDIGYAGHSNIRELAGLTNGCFLLTKSGNTRLAQTLMTDRSLAASLRTTTAQSLHVRDLDRD